MCLVWHIHPSFYLETSLPKREQRGKTPQQMIGIARPAVVSLARRWIYPRVFVHEGTSSSNHIVFLLTNLTSICKCVGHKLCVGDVCTVDINDPQM
jgi:hypothetical protein